MGGCMDVVSLAPAPISSWRVQYCMIAHDIASRSKVVVVVYCRILLSVDYPHFNIPFLGIRENLEQDRH